MSGPAMREWERDRCQPLPLKYRCSHLHSQEPDSLTSSPLGRQYQQDYRQGFSGSEKPPGVSSCIDADSPAQWLSAKVESPNSPVSTQSLISLQDTQAGKRLMA